MMFWALPSVTRELEPITLMSSFHFDFWNHGQAFHKITLEQGKVWRFNPRLARNYPPWIFLLFFNTSIKYFNGLNLTFFLLQIFFNYSKLIEKLLCDESTGTYKLALPFGFLVFFAWNSSKMTVQKKVDKIKDWLSFRSLDCRENLILVLEFYISLLF